MSRQPGSGGAPLNNGNGPSAGGSNRGRSNAVQNSRSGGRGGKWTSTSSAPSAGQPPVTPQPTAAPAPSSSKDSDSYKMHQHDRMMFLLINLVGRMVHVTVKDGTKYEGLFHAAITESELGVVLKLARKIAPKEDPRVYNTLIIMPKDLVLMQAKNIEFAPPEMPAPNAISAAVAERVGFRTDADISADRASMSTPERQLRKWADYDDDENMFELDTDDWTRPDSVDAGAKNAKWDQFAVNEKLFGVKTDYHEEIYTTKLDRQAPGFREQEREADRIAKEILKQSTRNVHVLEERGAVIEHMDEEDRYGAVIRNASAASSWRSRAQPSMPATSTASASTPKLNAATPAPIRKLQQEISASSPSHPSSSPARVPSRTNSPFRANSPAPLTLGVPARTSSPAPRSPVPSLGRARNPPAAPEPSNLSGAPVVQASASVPAPFIVSSSPSVSAAVPKAIPAVRQITERSVSDAPQSSPNKLNASGQLPKAMLEHVKKELLKGNSLYTPKPLPTLVEYKPPTKDELALSVASIKLEMFTKAAKPAPKPLGKDQLDEIRSNLLSKNSILQNRQILVDRVTSKRDSKPLEEKLAMSVSKYVTQEKERLSQKKLAIERKEKDKKLKELIAFSQSFSLKVPSKSAPASASEAEKDKKASTGADPATTESKVTESDISSISATAQSKAQRQALKLPPLKEVDSKTSSPVPTPTPSSSKFKLNIKASEFKPNVGAPPFQPRKTESNYNPFFGDRQLSRGKISIRAKFPQMMPDDVPDPEQDVPVWDLGDVSYRDQFQITNYYDDPNAYQQSVLAQQYNFPYGAIPSGGFRYPGHFVPGMPQSTVPLQPSMPFGSPAGIPHFSPQTQSGIPPQAFGSPQVASLRSLYSQSAASQSDPRNASAETSGTQSPQRAIQGAHVNQSPYVQPRGPSNGLAAFSAPPMMMPGGQMQPPMFHYPGGHMQPGGHLMAYPHMIPMGPGGVQMPPMMGPGGSMPMMIPAGPGGPSMMMGHPQMYHMQAAGMVPMPMPGMMAVPMPLSTNVTGGDVGEHAT